MDRETVRPLPPALAVTGTRRLTTIGVYGFTAETFLEKLIGGGVGLLLDVRQRRGVRGPDYSWANSTRLQGALAAVDISYRHLKDLAPTTELRQLQYREDDRQGVGKRNRVALAPEYTARYTREILDPFDLDALVADLPEHSATALLCVERDPEACHRSLIARRLRTEHGLPVTDLTPDRSAAI
ncbi:DUF488 domain-containing protein [Spirillospora sp. NBC_00431]